jgi:hypothetical protein
MDAEGTPAPQATPFRETVVVFHCASCEDERLDIGCLPDRRAGSYALAA